MANKTKRIFILSDQHYAPENCPSGGVDPYAESCALQAIGVIKPDIFINIGDAGEWDSVSPWRYKRRTRPDVNTILVDIEKDAEAVNAGLDRFDLALKKVGCKEKHFIEGNHEIWLDNLIEEFPKFNKQWGLQNILKFKERGFQYHEYGKYVKFGKAHIYHGGHFDGKYHTYRHVENLGANVIYAHVHDVQQAKTQSLGGVHGAWSLGCICKLSKKFLRGRPTNWSHAFGVMYLEPDGSFSLDVIDIIHGQCHVMGQKIVG